MLVLSCGKTYDPGPETIPPPGNHSVESIYTLLAVQPISVAVDADAGGSFRGSGGTNFQFPDSAFVSAQGVPVTGNVLVTVSEYLNKADMLFSGVLPTAGGMPLISGGEISLQATQNGQPLAMAPGKSFSAHMPVRGIDASEMQLFTGSGVGGFATAVNWKPIDSGSGTNFVYSEADTIGISSNQFTFLNVDKFLKNSDNKHFTLEIRAGKMNYSHDSIAVFTLFDGQLSVLQNREWVANKIEEKYIPGVPVHFVAFGIINGNFFGGILPAKPADDQNYIVDISKTDPRVFKGQVAALK